MVMVFIQTESANGLLVMLQILLKLPMVKYCCNEGNGRQLINSLHSKCEGDLTDISSITNGTGSGKISFAGDQVVKVEGEQPYLLRW